MVFNILKIKLKILQRRIDKEYNRRDKISLTIFLVIFIYLITYLIFFLLSKFNVTYSLSIKFNTLILMCSTLLMLSIMPLKIFNSFFENRKIEILILSPINLKNCFLCEFLSLAFKTILIFLCIIMPLLVADGLAINLSLLVYFNYILYVILLLLIIYLVSYITLFFLSMVINIQHLKKIIIIYTGIIELFFTCSVILISNYVNLNNFINNLDTYKFTKYFFYFSELMLYNRRTNVIFFLILLILIFYKLSYFLFYKSFYINGLFVNSSTNTYSHKKNLITYKLLNKFYFFNKDKKLLIRNFNLLKSIIFTLITFTITTIFSTNKTEDNYLFLLIINQLMTISVVSEINYNIVNLEKNKYEKLYLSKIDIFNFYLQKNVSGKLISFLFIFIYDFIILINFMPNMKQSIFYLLANIICITLISKPITLIMINISIINKWSIKNLFTIVKLIFYTLSLYSIILIFMYLSSKTSYIYFIILSFLLMFLLSSLIDTLIKKFLTNKKLNFI